MTTAVEIINRWVEHGGAWRCRPAGGESVEVDLCACTGEAQELLQVDAPRLVARLRQLGTEDPGLLRTDPVALG